MSPEEYPTRRQQQQQQQQQHRGVVLTVGRIAGGKEPLRWTVAGSAAGVPMGREATERLVEPSMQQMWTNLQQNGSGHLAFWLNQEGR